MPQNQTKLYPGDVITVSGKKVNFIVVEYRNKGAQSDDGPSIEFDCLEFGAALCENYGIRSLKVTNPKIDTFHITEQGMTGRGRGLLFSDVKIVGKSKVERTTATQVTVKDWSAY